MPASLIQTTLAVAVTDTTSRTITVASATSFVVGMGLYVDREYMVINNITGTVIGVNRGRGGTRATPHLVNTPVFVQLQSYFTTVDKYGAGTYANELVEPWINIRTGNMFSVVGGIWVSGNTYVGSTSYGLSPAIWSDCPLLQMEVNPLYGASDGDDFVGTGGCLVTANKYAFAGTNGTFTAVDAVMGGEVILTDPGADNDEIYVSANNNGPQLYLDAVSTWWFESRIKISQITVEQGIFVGLLKQGGMGADEMTDDTMALKVQNYLGFQVVEPVAHAPRLYTVQCIDAGARSQLALLSYTFAANTFVKLGMKSIAGTVTFYVDGVADATTTLSSSAQFPLNKAMCANWACKTGAASANTMTIDWWKIAQSRIAN